ncbi:MAG: hypothetical protein ABL888_00150 [Pirellulaceae bacterium]
MSLEEWFRNSWLTKANPNKSEIVQLLEVADRDLADGQVVGVSVDGRYVHLYEAALALCSVALRACSYQVKKGQGNHKRTIESLPLTLGNEYSKIADQIDTASRLRGQAQYDRSGVVSESDVKELLAIVVELRSKITIWLKDNYPSLI